MSVKLVETLKLNIGV
jgi:hypothetical protein